MSICDDYEQKKDEITTKINSPVSQGPSDDDWRQFTNLYVECILGGANGPLDPVSVRSAIAQELGVDTVPGFIDEQLIVQGQENPSSDPSQQQVNLEADPVMMFNGQFVHEVTDLTINGAGIEFAFRRTYKNQVPFNGPLGFNWTHNLHIWLRVANQTIFRATGDLREESFTQHPDFGSTLNGDFDYWLPPDGKEGVIFPQGNSFALRMPNGVEQIFQQDPAHSFMHRLIEVRDRHGNFLLLEYSNISGLLRQVLVNHPQRAVQFDYDEQGRICLIQDYAGRQWHYAYDSLGDLIAFTSPTTDRYTQGLTVCYDYSSAFFSGELQHNIIRIIDAAGQIYMENEYGTAPGLLSFNRVVRQRQGGGELQFEYGNYDQVLDFDYPDEQRPRHQTILIERNGQPVRHLYNQFGNLLRRDQTILEGDLPRHLVEHYRYNRDGNIIASLSPEGVLTQHLYGRDLFIRRHGLTPNGDLPTGPLTWRERQTFGRIRATVRRDGYDDFSNLSMTQGVFGDFPDIVNGIFPAGMGKRENDIIVKFDYENEFGQLKSVSDPRFTNSPNPDAVNEQPRFQETLTEYSYEGLAGGSPNQFLVSIKRPAPTFPDGTQGAAIVEAFRNANGEPGYDGRGRLLRHINPVGVVTEHQYFPPDPSNPLQEGYLQETVVDQGGLAITTRHQVDELGRVTQITLPRFVETADDRFRTQTHYNNLDQVIETTSSKPFEFRTRHYYDRNGKLERSEETLKNENGEEILGGIVVRTFCYDEEFHLIRETVGGGSLPEHLVTEHLYNSAGKRSQTIFPQGNQTLFEYNERMLQVTQTWAACSDEEVITRTEYDGDSRVKRTFDARGNATTFELDAFGRIIAEENALGHITRKNYDKAGNLICVRFFERRGEEYFLLARSETNYDELNRAIRTGTNRFDAPIGPLGKSDTELAFIQSPGPGSLLVTQTYYDDQNRVRLTIDPMGRETTMDYDNVDRQITKTDALGNHTESHYDAHGNVVRRDQIELVRDPVTNAISGQRVFSSSATFDEIDRMTSRTDSLGNVTSLFYDSRNNQVRQVDPLGNVIRTEFDIYNRRSFSHMELTDIGLGNGNLQATASTGFEYDRNGNLTGVLDPLGRQIQYRYDTLNRRRAIIYPDESEMHYDYDPDGNLIRTEDNNKLQRRYSVDALGRTIRVDVDKSGLEPGLTVEGTVFEAYEYDGLNRVILEENDFARCVTQYNSLGWQSQETVNFTTLATPMAQPIVITREFNDAGALTGFIYPSGRRLRFARDELYRLTGVQNLSNGLNYPGNPSTPDQHDIVTRIEYAGLQRKSFLYGNGCTIRKGYDGVGRLIEIEHRSPNEQLLTIQYLFDAVGNVRVRHDILPTEELAEKFAYDSFYRLAHEGVENRTAFNLTLFAPVSNIPPEPIPNRQTDLDNLIGSLELPMANPTFEYDLVGNRERERLADGSQVDYTVNVLDQYENRDGAVFTYDQNGNMKGDGKREYFYDSLNRLVRAVDPTTNQDLSRFFHDARGRLILEIINGTAIHIIWDGDDQIAEYTNGTPFALYVFDDGIDQPIQITAEGMEHWYHTDLVGSVRLLSDLNANAVTRYRYSSFGSMVQSENDTLFNPLRFTARRINETLNSYDFRARQYNPLLGRFAQRDPGEMIDGTNIYLYTKNAPLGYADPLGMGREEMLAGTSEFETDGKALRVSAETGKPYETNWLIDGPDWFNAALFGGKGPKARARYATLALRDDQTIIRGILDQGHGCAACHISNYVWGLYGPEAFNPENNLPYDWALNGEGYQRWVTTSSQARFFVEGMTSILNTKMQVDARFRRNAPESFQPSHTAPEKPPTFGNLAPGDKQPGGRVVRLVEENGKWFEYGAGKVKKRSASGTYDFVYSNGEILAVRRRQSQSIGVEPPGHLTLSKGERVQYAGQIRFSGRNNRGVLREWSNASGHYAPARGFGTNIPLPQDRFTPLPPSSGSAGGPGPQLPVFQ